MDLFYTIKFHTDWHCGSGLSASADVDSLPIKDAFGLPFVPGKTIKGLVREALIDLYSFSQDSSKEKVFLDTFGFFKDREDQFRKGTAFFSNAELPNEESKEIIRCNANKYLFRTISKTAIEPSTGIAKPHSLRKIDVTIPCQLKGYITGIPSTLVEDVKNALRYIKRLGTGRNRGLGRCTITIDSCSNEQENNIKQTDCTKLQFKCTLLSDVILNQKAATTGPNKTLDFIPGSNFLGIVADCLYQENDPSLTLDIIHSGKVRFGDAHPSIDNNMMIRGLHIPASMYYPKLDSPRNCYIHHQIPNIEALNKLQLKQHRSGYYDFSNEECLPVCIEKTFAIKSAYDNNKRKSKDKQLFGYESLRKGLVLLFEIEVDDKKYIEPIQKALHNGIYRIGRSRTAQYGQVKIERCSFSEIESQSMSDNIATIYADSRIIFIDEETGNTTFRPTPKQLGVDENATILWDKCQIRTFQHAPFNYQRQCFDTDRCGIEKGSVFVVKTTSCPNTSKYIGSYCNEGYGKVIYNPEFLQSDNDGKAKYKIQEDDKCPNKVKNELPINPNENDLLKYLANQQHQYLVTAEVYKTVNDWVERHRNIYSGERFASQWGTIRSIANQYNTKQSIYDAINTYTSNGIAKDKWSIKRRKEALLEFINATNDYNVQIAVINLAAEMAKICKKEDKQ